MKLLAHIFGKNIFLVDVVSIILGKLLFKDPSSDFNLSKKNKGEEIASLSHLIILCFENYNPVRE